MPTTPNFSAEQAALQAAIAAGGEHGQAQYQAEQSAIAASQAGALGILSGVQNNGVTHGSAPHGAAMDAQQTALSQLYGSTASQGEQYFNQDITRLNAANAARYQQAQVAAGAAGARGQREAGFERERMQLEREQMALERLRIQNEKEQMEREQELGTIANYSDAGKNLGWDNEYTNQVTQAGEQAIDADGTTSTPFAQMQMAAAEVSADPNATWADVQNAVRNAHDNWVATYGTAHGYSQGMSLVLASYAPRYGADGTQIGAKPMPDSFRTSDQRAAEEQAAIQRLSETVSGAIGRHVAGRDGAVERSAPSLMERAGSAGQYLRDDFGRGVSSLADSMRGGIEPPARASAAESSPEDEAILQEVRTLAQTAPDAPALGAIEVAAIMRRLPPMYSARVKENFERELLFGEDISLTDLVAATDLPLEALLLGAR